ncbi:MAG TPA: hypothetical protein DEF39_00565 [Hungateiclostridium thermocellum]|jgi:hypothetical protein|uniref:Uncharacterized protein n=2 Tax=Acetivibrio thermocellus TaxID=1515 RepID=G2JCD4_ACET2|nr:hypothetical protein [Acetivibrio thermocellus]CDG37024.1 putative membrane protein [Acetivibrio thermocellus BC1]ADU73227.1 hypothetical protein Clo1313_0131 [Acetivibrio thermocellus DSM 1313]AEO12456.1 hypothetical protein Cthe_3404 [Acetivibrio thermocellus ATCC 27405]ALX07144.1 hypothetical protein AD2_00133 [Acetivibrio thermocellus AD2]ANV74880.1 hypothetical protein LQRI_0132 [Acetivibrio thermocellus DSM 2360]
MKKAITIIILTCLFLLLGTLVFVKYEENASIKLVEKTIQEAQEINANSFMGMEYLEFAGL